jgi:hypothetical protein
MSNLTMNLPAAQGRLAADGAGARQPPQASASELAIARAADPPPRYAQ